MREKGLSRLGPYEVVAPLGAGGMGEVYRAWDPRLQREVALKVLPDGAASQPAQRDRLLQEARAASALTHPNILTVYDVGADDSTAFIASELIEGRRLSAEIERGALPTRRLLDLAVQLAAGLEAAHAAGIAHRDLKPDNVMVAADGRLKILDFGLARVEGPVDVPLVGLPSQTSTIALVGTVEYMSPEQARGRRGDYRSDQFSLGVILFEMATGRHPFRRDTPVATLAAIVEEDLPPIDGLNPRVPIFLRWIIERCLAKEPEQRYASTADLARDLRTLRDRLPELQPAERRPGPQRARTIAAPAAITGVLLLLAGLAGIWLFAPAGSEPTFTPLVTDDAFQSAPAWSPDGQTVAYVGQDQNGILQIFTRHLASSLRAQVTFSNFDCTDPFWSPDGTRIYYHSLALDTEGLWSVTAAGGTPIPILENASRATLSPDGATLFFLRQEPGEQPGMHQSVWVASSNGENARRYTEAPFEGQTFVGGFLRFAPDGSKLLIWVWGWSPHSGIPAPGFWIVPWPAGSPYPVAQNLADLARALVTFDWLPDSRHVVAALWDARKPSTRLWTVDTTSGHTEPLTLNPGSEGGPSATADGRRVAFTLEAVDFDLVQIPLDGSAPQRLLKTSRSELDPAFGREGSRYAYVTDRRGTLELWLGSVTEEWERPIVDGNRFADPTWALGDPSISPDGSLVAYQRYGKETGYRIWLSTVAAAGPPVQLAPGAEYQNAPTWSPEGDWIAFHERREGRLRLAKMRVGSDAPPEIIREDPVLFTRVEWSPDGRWILYDSPEGVAIVTPNGQERHVISDEVWIVYGWSPDSSQVYGLREAEASRHYMLVAIDIRTRTERIVNADLGLIPRAHQPIRGFSRIGTRAFATSIADARSDIWMLDGIAPPRTWFRRIARP